MYRHMHTLESLPTVAPVEDCAHPTTDPPSHSQQTILTISIIPIFIFGLVTVIALVSCLWPLPLLHIYHTIMCKVEVRQKKRMGKRKELTAKRGSASGGRRKFLHVSCYEYITVYNTVHVFNT